MGTGRPPGRPKKVYDWEPYRDIIYSLYVEQKRSLPVLQEYLTTEHNFTPSRRHLQAQFQKWDFPRKYRRTWKDENLVARVKELWEANHKHADILAMLKDEGFDIESNELVNLRKKFGMTLRLPGMGFEDRGKAGDEDEESGSEEDSDSQGESESDEEEDRQDGRGVGRGNGEGASASPVVGGLVFDGEYHAMKEARKAERKRMLEMEHAELWATKKRRRHTKPFAGLPADPPAPPRFPSETTLEEAKAILQISVADYRDMRAKFQRICEENGVAKKTVCGPERWEALKEQLIRECMYLRAVMWDPADMDRKRLAVEIISNDVTKRIRVIGNVMSISEAKRVFGLNPKEGNEVRAVLYRMLEADRFVSKREDGEEHWEELKRIWLERTNLTGRVTGPLETDKDGKRVQKAIFILAKDALRRYCQDVKKKAAEAAAPPKPPKPRIKAKPKPKPAPKPTPVSTNTRSQRAQQQASTAPVQTHTQARLLPRDEADSFGDDGYDPGPDPFSPESEDGQPSESHNPFLTQEYIQAYQAATNGQQAVSQTGMPAHQPPPAPASAPAPAPAPVQSSTVGVYFRLHPSSSIAAPAMWISTITSRSIGELREAAVARFSELTECVGIEGIIKDGKGGEMLPLPINDDSELGAYLDHVQGMMAPTFSVTLAPGEEEWE
ncbi:hypothetical protein B0T14DRAFT_502033 [Immersiella caudata]|uniref:Clr5 domain-containing protein n=1 Tax=Immersiella caudata TaxID=314043 RepID=A0AA39XCX3_9PEZI|nr:hypothetical protein B0T14DRAFT_502033 [Immersiella caudata]